MVMKFDPYSALLINRNSLTLILFHLYCCSELNCLLYSECSFCHVNILIQIFIHYKAFCVFLSFYDIIIDT